MRSHSRLHDWDARARRRTGRARRRLKALLSAVQVVALAAGSFFLLPVIVRAQQHDVFFVPPGGQGTLHCEFTDPGPDGGHYPGDTQYCRRRVGTNTDLDVSMLLYLNEDSFRVYSWDPAAPDERGPEVHGEAREEFISFWRLSLVTRPVVTRSLGAVTVDSPTSGDAVFTGERDVAYDSRFVEVCPPTPLAQVDGGPNRDASGRPLEQDEGQMCDMGVVRGIASERAFADSGEPAYERQYFIGMTEIDTGEDQTAFRGWSLVFDMVFRASVPAEDTCPTTRTATGGCLTPLYQRP